MAAKPQSPFAGFPATRKHTDKSGNLTFTVTPLVLTPLRAKAADLLGDVSAAALLIGGVYVVSHLPDATGAHWLASLFAPWLCHHLFKVIWRYLLRKETKLVLTADEFRVWTWLGWKIFDRQLPHKFAAIRHDMTVVERDRNDLEVRKAQASGKIISKPRYYGESFHLSFEYLDQRNDVMTIFGQKEARAVRDRLKAVDEVLNAAMRKGTGIPLNPEQEWSDLPGDIPENN